MSSLPPLLGPVASERPLAPPAAGPRLFAPSSPSSPPAPSLLPAFGAPSLAPTRARCALRPVPPLSDTSPPPSARVVTSPAPHHPLPLPSRPGFALAASRSEDPSSPSPSDDPSPAMEPASPATPSLGLPSDAAPSLPPSVAPSSAALALVFEPWVSLLLHAATAGLVAATFFNGSLFGYHPTLMAASFLLFMPEAILAAVRGTGKGRKAALFRHLYLNAASGLAGLGGLYSIWLNKERNSKPHLATWHALLGAVAFVISSLIASGGVPLLFGFPAALRQAGLPKVISSAHKKIGTAVFLLGVLVSLLGLQTFKPAHRLHKGALTYGMAALALTSAGLVLLTIQHKRSKLKPT